MRDAWVAGGGAAAPGRPTAEMPRGSKAWRPASFAVFRVASRRGICYLRPPRSRWAGFVEQAAQVRSASGKTWSVLAGGRGLRMPIFPKRESTFRGEGNESAMACVNTTVSPRVLVVEDDADTADLLDRYTRLVGCDTRLAANGEEALRRALEFFPQIVLLDIGLPDCDGWQIARELRRRLAPLHPVLIAVTGACSAEDRRRSWEAGIEHHLVKPAFRKELIELLLPLVGKR